MNLNKVSIQIDLWYSFLIDINRWISITIWTDQVAFFVNENGNDTFFSLDEIM